MLTTFNIQHESIDLTGNIYGMTLSNLYYLIVSLQMETENVSDQCNSISVSTGLQNEMDRYETDQKGIWCNGNIV